MFVNPLIYARIFIIVCPEIAHGFVIRLNRLSVWNRHCGIAPFHSFHPSFPLSGFEALFIFRLLVDKGGTARMTGTEIVRLGKVVSGVHIIQQAL